VASGAGLRSLLALVALVDLAGSLGFAAFCSGIDAGNSTRSGVGILRLPSPASRIDGALAQIRATACRAFSVRVFRGRRGVREAVFSLAFVRRSTRLCGNACDRAAAKSRETVVAIAVVVLALIVPDMQPR